MEKLELKHLACYLPYGLTVMLGTTERNITAVCTDSKFVFVDAYKGSRDKQMAGIENIKPILRPLSDLSESWLLSEWNKEHNIRLRYEKKILLDIESSYYIDLIGYPLDLINQLLSWHFDVFGLIDKGLAIDINKI